MPFSGAWWSQHKGKSMPTKPKGGMGSTGIWAFFSLMYLFTSDTVEPVGKLEFFWRMLAGPFNFLPGV